MSPNGTTYFESEEDFEALRSALVGAVARACPSWPAERREDLVQVASLRLLDRLRKHEGQSDFTPFYLKRVAHSVLVDELRRQRRQREVPLENDEGDEEVPVISSTAQPAEVAVGKQIGRGIRSCLVRLAKPRRLAVTLHLQGHSVPETAELLGWARKRAENLVYRGLQDLRECLKNRGLGR